MSDASPPRSLFAFLGAATFFEGFDFIALTQVLPDVRRTWGLDEAQGGWLVGVCNLGPIAAWLLVRQADRVGRSRVLTWTIAGYTLSSLATAAAPSAAWFAVAQLFARAFLIGEWAVCLVYAAEVYPAATRGRTIAALQGLAAVGAVLCAGLTPTLLHSPLGWRAVYVVGALPLGLLAWARRSLPESPRFLAQGAPSPSPLLALVQGPYRGRVLRMATLWFLTYAGTHLALTFWKEYAVAEAHLTDGEVGRSLAIASVVAMPIVFVTGRVLDSIGRRRGAAILFPITAASVFGAFTLVDAGSLTLALCGVMFGVNAVLSVMEALTAELFPTEHRSDAFGWANNLLGRWANVLLPPIAGALAMRYGWGPTVAASGVALLFAVAGILAWVPETKARELEQTARL